MARAPSNIDQAREFFRAYNDALKEMGVGGKQFETIMAKIGKQVVEQKRMSEDSLKTFKDMVEEAGKVLTNQENIGSEKRKEVVIDQKLFGKKKDILKLVTDEGKRQKIVTDEIINQRNKTNEAYNKIHGFLKSIPAIGSALGSTFDVVGPYVDKYNEIFAKTLPESVEGAEIPLKAKMKAGGMAIGKVGGIAIGGAIVGYLKKAFDTMRELGLSAGKTMGLGLQVFFSEQLKGITEEFGSINDSSLKLVGSMKMFSFFTGTSTADLAKTVGLMAATSNLSNEALMNQIKTTHELAAQAGIPIKSIMADVASNAEFVAKFSKDGGKNIMGMALHAKKLGVSLGEVSTIAGSLLDFETSIDKQMQAQVLLGRNINMDKARQLAFTGKHTEMMDEVLRQVGDEAGWNKMNYLQREAIAGLIGLSSDKMGNLIRAEKQAVVAAAKQKQQWLGIGTAVGALFGLILGGLAFFTGGLSLAGIGAMAATTVAGAGIGYGITSLVQAKTAGAPEFANLPGNTAANITRGQAVADAGETIVRTESFDLKQTNIYLKQISNKQDTLISRIGDLAL